jgi:aldehyde:ferredoxin oxidoreductase
VQRKKNEKIPHNKQKIKHINKKSVKAFYKAKVKQKTHLQCREGNTTLKKTKDERSLVACLSISKAGGYRSAIDSTLQ